MLQTINIQMTRLATQSLQVVSLQIVSQLTDLRSMRSVRQPAETEQPKPALGSTCHQNKFYSIDGGWAA